MARKTPPLSFPTSLLSLALLLSYFHWLAIILYNFFLFTKPLTLITQFYLKGHEGLSATVILGILPLASLVGALIGYQSPPNPTSRRLLLSASIIPLTLFLFIFLL